MLLGGAFGAMAVVAIFAVFVFPSPGVQIDVNQNDPVLEYAMASYDLLSLEEIFERTESGTVSIESKRDGQESLFRGIGSGFRLI